jgi:hypothetical protein
VLALSAAPRRSNHDDAGYDHYDANDNNNVAEEGCGQEDRTACPDGQAACCHGDCTASSGDDHDDDFYAAADG